MTKEEKARYDKGRKRSGKCTPELRAYHHAKQRCLNPKDSRYAYYGGRGILFKFQSFEEFLQELGLRPSSKHSLDRKENDGHYEVGNVKWSTQHEQMKNRRKVQALHNFSDEDLIAEVQRRNL